MKINGIIILRNTDLKRFFDLSTFWNEKNSILELIDQRSGIKSDKDKDIFFDNEEEFSLYKNVVRPWLLNKEFSAMIDNDYFCYCTNSSDNQTVNVKLGKMAKHIVKAKQETEINERHILGLTGLYLMLGINEQNSEILPDFNNFVEMKTGVMIDRIVKLSTNLTIEFNHHIEYPITSRTLANISDTSITLYIDKRAIILEPNQCITGIFHNQICHRILPNSFKDYDNVRSLDLLFNREKTAPFLNLAERGNIINTILNVNSFAFDNNGFPIYTTLDGELHIPDNDFTENQQMEGFKELYPGVPILAIENNKGNLIYYTSNFIYY